MRRRWSATGSLTLIQLMALLPLVHQPAKAQVSSRLAPSGVQVRVTGTNGARTTGVYLDGSRDSLWILASGGTDTAAFERERIARLERSLGFRSNLGRGARLGAIVGTLTGVGIGAVVGVVKAAGESCNEDYWGDWCSTRFSAGAGALAGGLLGGASGAIVGLIVGAVTSGEAFEDVQGIGLERITVFPSGDGSLNLGLSFQFGRAGIDRRGP